MVLGAYAVEAQGVKRVLLLRRGEGRRFVLAPRRFLRKLSRALLLRASAWFQDHCDRVQNQVLGRREYVTLAIESIESLID